MNLYAELKAERPGGDYPKDNNSRGSRVLKKGRKNPKPPDYRRYSDKNPKKENVNTTEEVPEMVIAGEAQFLYYSDRKYAKPKHHWL